MTAGTLHTNKVAHIGFDLVRAQILTQVMTYGIKYSVRRNRPTGECCAFPSGHAASTFATAAVLERHFGLRAAWPTMLIASYVAASRLHDNRHFASDVVFGAALGLTTGIAFPQLIAADDGRVVVVECAARIPGGQMADLVRFAVGVDLVDVQLAMALGDELTDELDERGIYRRAARVRF